LRTLYLGTSDFAASVLERLAAGPHRPALVVTRPDRPQGRGRRMSPPAVAVKAAELGLAVLQPEKVNDDTTRAQIAEHAPEAAIVCAFGALIKEPLLSDYEMLNVHPSLLPRWRGAAPIERAIMAGDAQTGVSIMRLTAGLDSGPVCLVGTEPIADSDDYGSLALRLQRVGADLLIDALDELAAGRSLDWREQDEANVTYAEKIDAVDRSLDGSRTAGELALVVRALHPHIGARAVLPGGEMLGVLRAAAVDQPLAGSAAAAAPAVAPGSAAAPAPAVAPGSAAAPAPAVAPGSAAAPAPAAGGPVGGDAGEPVALFQRDGELLMACADGALQLLEVKPAGGRAMPGAEYVRGHALPSG
jgi:methionyl-tRNA formyltransferase